MSEQQAQWKRDYAVRNDEIIEVVDRLKEYRDELGRFAGELESGQKRTHIQGKRDGAEVAIEWTQELLEGLEREVGTE